MDRETVFQQFLQFAGLDAQQGEPWMPLCEAACAQLEGRLRPQADPKDGRLVLAAAACAAHWQQLAAGGTWGDHFTVGEVSVSSQSGQGDGDSLGQLYEGLLAAAAPLLSGGPGGEGLWQVRP